MDFVKIDKNKFKEIYKMEVNSNFDIYILKDKMTIGYGLLQKDDIKIYVYVNEQFRGNGYGNIIFKELINRVNTKDISLSVPKSNLRINKIIQNNGGIEILSQNNQVFYTIPIINKTS